VAAAVVALLAVGGIVALVMARDDGGERVAPGSTTASPATTAPPTADDPTRTDEPTTTEEPTTTTTEEPTTSAVPTTGPDETLPTGYTEENREQFLRGCTSTVASEEQCICVIDRIEAEVPFEVYSDYAANPTAGLPPQIQAIVQDCALGEADD